MDQGKPKAKLTKPEKVIGPNEGFNPGVEANLDTQYIMGVGRDVPSVFYSTAGQQPGSPENEPFAKWLSILANTSDTDLPLTISTSYGDNENTVVRSYAERVNVEFQKLGLRGTSIMFSSGDGGVAGGQATRCDKFIPTFPAASIYVTAVGGTTGSSPETAARFSSGGFSNYWARPSYQDEGVQAYLNSTSIVLPDSDRFNASGAGFPDVSAQAENFAVVESGFATPVDGTSCSSPAFTAVISLVNEARLAAGKSSLGYLNQIIWKRFGPGGVFNDITTGSNPGCGTEGFPATKGWSPVTGWGTPSYTRLVNAALELP